MTEQKFYELCKAHDLTYQYSDDHTYWRRGEEQRDTINAAAAKLPRAVAVRIWNSVVDEKLVESAREAFYWTE